MENTEWYIDEARQHTARKFRDELFADANRFAFADDSLPIPPAQGNDPESDMRALTAWCLEFKRASSASSDKKSPAPLVIEDDFRASAWFEENTSVTADSLRQAVSDGKFLRTVGPPKKKRYSLTDAKAIWGSDIVHP
jgi:hypothetical protein